VGIVDSLVLCLPLYIANAGILFFWRLGLFDRIPLLKNEFFRRPLSKPLFGIHRNLQGALFIVAVSSVGYLLLLGKLIILPGVLMFVAILANSYLKRRLGMKDGSPFPPLDQLDFLAGGIAGLYLSGYYIDNVALVAAATFFLHLGANMLAYRLGLKDVWW